MDKQLSRHVALAALACLVPVALALCVALLGTGARASELARGAQVGASRSVATTSTLHKPGRPGHVQGRSAATTQGTAPTAGGVPRPDHVVVAVEENHSFSEIIGYAGAPYINALAQQGALFTNSHGVEHPSQPNYLDLFSGINQGVTSDSCPHTFSAQNLGSELIDAGLTFIGYSEDLPAPGSTVCTSGWYARKHNPWVNFTNVPPTDNLPFTYFPTDYSTLPTLSFVIPNQINDMHSGSIQQGDTWLQQHLGSYVQWAGAHNSLFILTFDEDDFTTANLIPTIFVGPMVVAGQYSELINHYNMLRTMEDMYDLPYAGLSGGVPTIADVWVTGSPTVTPTPQRSSTPTVSSSGTPTGTPTNTPTNPATGTLSPTNSPTNTPDGPTNTGTVTPSPAITDTPTGTSAATNTATPTPTLCAIGFIDVQASDYFYEPVRYLYCRGVISGYGDNSFRPYNLTTRGQLCKIVALAQGWPLYTPLAPTFRDVPADNPFYALVETAYHQGIISGYSCGADCLEFRPGNNVTRGQLCKIIVLAQGWGIYTPPTPTFRDVPSTDPFYGQIETAYSHSIISGYGCGEDCLEFRPGNNATRGQICKIVYQALHSR